VSDVSGVLNRFGIGIEALSMTEEEKFHVAAQIEAARKLGVEEGHNQKDREWSRWERFKIILGLLSLLSAVAFLSTLLAHSGLASLSL